MCTFYESRSSVQFFSKFFFLVYSNFTLPFNYGANDDIVDGDKEDWREQWNF